MTTFAEHRRQARRLKILQLLAEAPAYEASAHLIYQALPGHGVASSVDQVAVDIGWLADLGLLAAVDLAGVKVARISARGLDVALGRAIVPGIARPEP